jgi:nucleoid-associated protein YgaU
VTRELKLALIVGFALVLVVTVLISDHLSHARQTKLASLPSDPAKVTEPLPIALENGADNLPRTSVSEPVAHAPAPLIGSMPGTDLEPLILTQGTNGGIQGQGPLTQPPVANPGSIDLINPTPQATQIAQNTAANSGVQPIASNPSPRPGSIEDAVARVGGTMQGNNIYIPGVQTARETINPTNSPAPLTATPADPTLPVAVNTPPATPDRLHTVSSGDNLFKLSGKYYSDGKMWRKLAKYNGIDAETPLKVGQKLKVPTMNVLLGRPASAPTTSTTLAQNPGTTVPPMASGNVRPVVLEPRPLTTPARPVATAATTKTRPYTIKKGDSLAVIAQRELGTTKRAKDILELNRKIIKNPDSVPLGATILLPAA